MRGVLVGIFAFVFLCAWPVMALEEPSEDPVLKVEGKIAERNSETAALFDIEMLRSLGTHTILTDTPWTKGETTFEGVLLRCVLNAVGATGNLLRAVSLNDYATKIPVSDAEQYDVILAFSRDGQEMGVRERGPLWVIYPWREVSELRNRIFYIRSIWQLKSISVEDD
ncbi:MAG: molybdopterin-dependent oxidoreductase [Pseudomonadota bacterium]